MIDRYAKPEIDNTFEMTVQDKLMIDLFAAKHNLTIHQVEVKLKESGKHETRNNTRKARINGSLHHTV